MGLLSEHNLHRAEDIFEELLTLRRADVLAQSMYQREEKLSLLDQWEATYKTVLEKNQCMSLKSLAITGRDLIEEGMKPGKELGDVLQALLEHVLDAPEDNTKEILIAYFHTHLHSIG